MEWIIIGIVCLALGATGSYLFVSRATNTKVQQANSTVEEARDKAKRIKDDALRDAETAKKTALVEAREEILQLKQKSDLDDKRRKENNTLSFDTILIFIFG